MYDVKNNKLSVIFFVLGFLLAPGALVAPRSLSVLLPLAFLAFLWSQRRNLGFSQLPKFVGAPEALLLMLLSTISIAWVADPELARDKLFSVVGTFVCGVGLAFLVSRSRPEVLRPILFGLTVGIAVATAYLLIEALSGGYIIRSFRGYKWTVDSHFLKFNDYGLSPLFRGIAVVSILAWPAAGFLFAAKRPVLALALLVSLPVIAWLSSAQAPTLAFLVAGIVFLATFFRPVLTIHATAAIVVIGILFAPAIQMSFPDPVEVAEKYDFLPSSGLHRIGIWETTVSHIEERPLTGSGFLSSRMLYSEKDKVPNVLGRSAGGNPDSQRSEPIPLHPHNIILQWWLELGMIGAILFAVWFFRAIRALRNSIETLAAPVVAAALSASVAALTQMSLSYGAWQTWWMSGLFLCGAMTIGTVVHCKVGSSDRPQDQAVSD